MMRFWGIAAAVLLAGPAAAQERDYCPNRPGLGTPACTIAPGRVSVETALADWTRDDMPDSRQDTILLGDTLVRLGVADAVELQLGWTPFGHVRERDRMTDAVTRAERVGDVYVGTKINFAHPDGSGLAIAVQPFATLPVGRAPVGAGDWGAGLVVPVTYDVSDTINVQLNGEADAAVDEDGDGRHLAYSGTAGIAVSFTDTVTGELEVEAARDNDPERHATSWLTGLSVGWMVQDVMQLDAGANLGLDRDAPDAELYLGMSRRF